MFLPYPRWGEVGVVSWQVVAAALSELMDDADSENAWIKDTDVSIAGGGRSRVMRVAIEVTSTAHLEQAAQEVFARVAKLDTKLSAHGFRPMIASMALEYIQSWDSLDRRGRSIADFMQFTRHNWFMLREMRTLAETKLHEEVPAIARTLVPGRSHVAFLTPSGGAATKLSAAAPSASHDLTPWRPPVEAAAADLPVEIDAARPAAPSRPTGSTTASR